VKFDGNDILLLAGFASLAGGTWLVSGAACLITVGSLLLVGGVVGELRRMKKGKPQ
jgi:hypothetical protein